MNRRIFSSANRSVGPGRTACAVLVAAMVIAAAGGPVSCSSSGGRAGKAGLTRASTTESGKRAFTPDTRAMNAPAPPGLDPALTKVIPDTDVNARLSLDEALAKVAGLPTSGATENTASAGAATGAAEVAGAPAGEAAAPEVAPERRAEALRLYAQGRVARLSGDAASAAIDLQKAARLDPSTAAVWRELGEAQLATGNRAFASASFARALERDPDDVRALEQNSRIAVERRDFARGAALTARLLKQPLEPTDPALPYIAWSQLARSLAPLGFTGAAAEAAMRAADLPERFQGLTGREQELNALYRQRGDTLRDAGDSMLQLGRYDEAARIYESAAALPTMSPAALLPRRVFAAMKRGDGDAAARLLLDELAASRGRADEILLPLVAHVSSHAARGASRITAGIDTIEASLDDPQRLLAASSLARSRAAASDTARALPILRARLAAAPSDEDTLRDLFSRLRGAPRTALVEECLGLIDAAPLQERRYGTALSRELAARRARGSDAREPSPENDSAENPLAGIDAARADGAVARLLRARLFATENKPEEALRELEPIGAVSSPTTPANSTAPDARDNNSAAISAAAVIARVSLLMPLGRHAEADALLASLPETDALVRSAKGLAVSQRGDDNAALTVLGPLLEPDAALPPGIDRAELLVSAAQMCLRRGEGERARDLLERALAADPLRDDAYVGLVALYAPGQPLADETKLVETIRRMRDANPSSRSLRWLRAQESLSRGQLDLAERDLADLAEESPTQPEIVTALNQVWLRTGSASKAEAWLRAKAERFPDASILVTELADAVVAQGRLAEAETLLSARLKQTPGDAGVSRALERLYRGKLNEPEKADTLAKARLAGAPLTPDTLLEQADLAWRDQRIPEASDILRDLLRRFPRVVFRPDQAARVGEFIMTASDAAIKENQVAKPLVDLVSALTDASPSAGIAVLMRRLQLAGVSGAVDGSTMVKYIEEGVKRFPRQAEEMVIAGALSAWTTVRSEVNVRLPKAELELLAKARQRGLDIVEASPRLLGKMTPRVALMWLEFASTLQKGESFVRAIETAKSDNVFDALIASMDPNGNPNARQVRRRTFADNAYQLAGILTFLDQEAAAERMLRDALKYDPRHAPSCNDLGYRMLVADRSIDEAAGLIEIAVEQEPNRSSYLDSLGWARYKQGIVFDDTDPKTGKKREGAVTLISRALDQMTRENNTESRTGTPIIVDHLGDSVWAAGDHETAVRHWELAAQDAEGLLQADDKARAADDPDETEGRLGAGIRKELETVLAMTRLKSVAARAGKDPQVSKMHAPANQPGNEPPAPGEADAAAGEVNQAPVVPPAEAGIAPNPVQPAPAPAPAQPAPLKEPGTRP
jgi:tetratricopeptide (TPR) repeat protein